MFAHQGFLKYHHVATALGSKQSGYHNNAQKLRAHSHFFFHSLQNLEVDLLLSELEVPCNRFRSRLKYRRSH